MNSDILKWFLIVILFLGVYGCVNTHEPNPNTTYPNDFTLSPDGKRILFSLSKGNRHYDLALYEIATGTIKTFKMTGSDYYLEPVFSPNGKEIAYVAGKRLKGANIYILNCATGNIRQITHTESIYPESMGPFNTNKLLNFSPDGRKIIYCRSGFVKPSVGVSKIMTTDWDIFEVDILTGAEHKLTNQQFFTIRRPYYLPDGKRFIFSASIVNNKSMVGPKDFIEYRKLYQGNEIFIMDGKTNELKPAFIHGDESRNPSVSGNGEVVFVSIPTHLDGIEKGYPFELFIHNKASIERLTKNGFSNELNNPFISFDGSRVVFQANKKERGKIGWSVWLINRDGTGLREVNFMDLLNNKG